jgi:hypothetical protein
MKRSFTRVVAIGALATALSGGVMSSSQALTLPVTPVQGIAGARPAEHVQWRGYGWGRGYGWRRPNYGGAIAAGAIAGGLLGLATAATTSSYYGYGYGYGSGYGYPSYGYSYYPSSYSYPSYSYGYSPSYYSYGSAYGYAPSYYGSSYWLSGGRAHKRKHARHGR